MACLCYHAICTNHDNFLVRLSFIQLRWNNLCCFMAWSSNFGLFCHLYYSNIYASALIQWLPSCSILLSILDYLPLYSLRCKRLAECPRAHLPISYFRSRHNRTARSDIFCAFNCSIDYQDELCEKTRKPCIAEREVGGRQTLRKIKTIYRAEASFNVW